MVAWQLFIYRLPTNPSRLRVGTWRELRRLGALPLQNSVSVVPELGDLMSRLDAIQDRVEREGGTVYRYRLPELTAQQRGQLESEWNALRTQEYAEIVEECEQKFTREIEFEIFRNNLTAGEAEEIEADLDKIRAWFERVHKRDCFKAPKQAEARQAIERCQELLDDFVERVYLAEAADGPALEPPVDVPWGETDEATDTRVVPLRPGPRNPQAADDESVDAS